ncbi:hypothetical protein WJX73_006495 [Symbiochloris irregularis]|uniref:DNA-directed RNA polymerase III subunit RPC5 n=1 Tax=Symbiochloris irregularis TaxID=706552 RepID=A0AAW1NU51_9CHLO
MASVQDRVVRELDVFVTTTANAEGHQAYLLQYPLRPAWRPYDLQPTDKVEMRVKAQRVKLKTKLDTAGPNYHADRDKERQAVDSMVLESAVATPPAPLAAAVIKGNQVVLLPIEASWQLRPSLEHLDEAPPQALKEPHAAEAEELTLVQARVHKRETDRQTEMRLKSWHHLKAEEAKEQWQPLDYISADRPAAMEMLKILSSTKRMQQAAAMSMQRMDYLEALLPGGQQESSAAPKSPAAVASLAATKALAAMFGEHSTASLATIRAWLQQSSQAGPAKAAAEAADDALHEAIAACGGITCIRGTYVLQASSPGQNQEYRSLLLDLLASQPCVKKAEILAAARKRNIDMSDSDYARQMMKVIKDLCAPSGSNWALRAGR